MARIVVPFRGLAGKAAADRLARRVIRRSSRMLPTCSRDDGGRADRGRDERPRGSASREGSGRAAGGRSRGRAEPGRCSRARIARDRRRADRQRRRPLRAALTTCMRCWGDTARCIASLASADGRTNALSSDSEPLRAALRAAQADRFQRARASWARAVAVAIRTSPTMSTRVRISTCAPARRTPNAVRAPGAQDRFVKVLPSSPARRRRALSARHRRCGRSATVTRSSRRPTTSKCCGLRSRPTSTACSTPCRLATTSAAGAGRTRLERACHRRVARGESGFASATATSGCTSCVASLNEGRRFHGDRATRSGTRRRGRDHPATTVLRTWLDTTNGSFPFQEWFRRRAHRDLSTAFRFEGGLTRSPRPVCSTRCTRRT